MDFDKIEKLSDEELNNLYSNYVEYDFDDNIMMGALCSNLYITCSDGRRGQVYEEWTSCAYVGQWSFCTVGWNDGYHCGLFQGGKSIICGTTCGNGYVNAIYSSSNNCADYKVIR